MDLYSSSYDATLEISDPESTMLLPSSINLIQSDTQDVTIQNVNLVPLPHDSILHRDMLARLFGRGKIWSNSSYNSNSIIIKIVDLVDTIPALLGGDTSLCRNCSWC